MKIVIVSAFTSILTAITTASMFSASYATPSSENIQRAISTGQCIAKTSLPYMTTMARCGRDEVMTGLWNDRLYCAQIEIECQ